MDRIPISYLCGDIKSAVGKIKGSFTEIRLRREKPVIIMRNGKGFFLGKNGELYSLLCGSCLYASGECFDRTFEAVCRYSIHSFQESICSGFITLDGGHRVGICGTAVMRSGNIINVKDISGLNFRVAREMKGCSEKIYNKTFSSGLSNVLIAGAPASGKTTFLRDLARILGSQYKTAVIDERGEIAAVCGGIPQNDVGANTDIFNGYSKRDGIETAVRSMSPDIIICDEAGNDEDFSSFRYAMTCGVKICASIHASCMEDISAKKDFCGEFDYIVFLDKIPGNPFRIVKAVQYDKNGVHNFPNADCGPYGKLFCGQS